MRIAFKTLVLSSAALCATAAFAANQARVNVPFSFTAKGHSFPAGAYGLALDLGQNTLTLDSKADPAVHLSWIVGPSDAAQTLAVMRFDKVGSDYSLKNLQLGQRITPNLDKHGKQGISATTSIGGQ